MVDMVGKSTGRHWDQCRATLPTHASLLHQSAIDIFLAAKQQILA